MASYLLQARSKNDGQTLRQYVVEAENDISALVSFADLAKDGEFLTAVPTGSVPDTAVPEPSPAVEADVAPLLGSAPEPFAPAEEFPVVEVAETAVSKLVAFLKSVDPDLLADVLGKLR